MPVRIVRLGEPREQGEGLRIGTVRRPPRGVPRSEFAARDFYDTWLPELAPSQELVTRALHAETEREWSAFVRDYRKEMATPQARHLLELVAALSHQTNVAVGCYCEDEARCHRSVLRELLADHGARGIPLPVVRTGGGRRWRGSRPGRSATSRAGSRRRSR